MKIFTIAASLVLFISCTGSYYSNIYHSTQPNLQPGEEYETITENTFLTPSEYPLSTFAIDVDGASYSNIRRMIMDGRLPVKDAVRVEEMINYFNYNYEQPRNEEPFSVHTDIGPSPWNPEHQLVQIGIKGKEIHTDDLPPSNLVFFA